MGKRESLQRANRGNGGVVSVHGPHILPEAGPHVGRQGEVPERGPGPSVDTSAGGGQEAVWWGEVWGDGEGLHHSAWSNC